MFYHWVIKAYWLLLWFIRFTILFMFSYTNSWHWTSCRPVDVAIAKDRSGCLGMKLGIANYGPAFGLLLHASLSLLLAV